VSFDAHALANTATRGLRPYDPGHDLPALRTRFGTGLCELGSNENSHGPSPAARVAIESALPDIFRYPDPKGAALKIALAAHLGCAEVEITLGNGSHEILILIAQCFADAEHEVIFSQFGFAVFSIATQTAGARAVAVAALPRAHATMPLGHDLATMAEQFSENTRLVYLANPNNPTGTWFGDAELLAFLQRVPAHVLVVVDEAYHEFVTVPELSSALRFVPQFPNLIVTRTFSKAYALAGLRIGYARSSAAVAGVLECLRESFNVNVFGLAAAQAALADQAHVAKVRIAIANERDWLTQQLRALGLFVFPSQTNFVLVDFARDAAVIEKALFERAVVVRPMGGYGLPQCLRISIGIRAENQAFLDALTAVLAA
jgi:histidinol-phosphate aminotransferase